jgi:poly-gamma-glutamate capsule biosynthesis protein CapA/YwtB (metallophosphatase superfamily)
MDTRNWKVAIAGEVMATRPFSMYDEPGFLDMVKLLRDADVTYAHLEINIGDLEEVEWASKGEKMGSYFMVDPRIADDLKWAGIDIVSNAFNHSGDFGASGIISTRRHCKRAGLACAGTGKDLEEARSPGYLETRKGRAALVSTATGNSSPDWASLPKGGTRGRPGVNPLRYSLKCVVDRQTAEQLKEAGRKLDILSTRPRSRDGSGGEMGEFSLSVRSGGGINFQEGDRFEIISTVHEKDLERNCRAVDGAMQMSDLVLVGHHCSMSEGPRTDYPPRVMREAAKAFIDAGADIYLGHGWHRTLGIEIYKDKPIFYGLGNFIVQSQFLGNVPYDSYESYGYDVDRLPTLSPANYPLHPVVAEKDERWWSSAVSVIEMEGHKMTGMKLYPVEMGREASRDMTIRRRTGSGSHPLTEGRPMLADKKNGQRILERIQGLSAAFGTKIEIIGGVGEIRL